MAPNLPTDSLYKFIALAGIAVFITGAYLLKEAFYLEIEISKQLPALERQTKDSSRHADWLVPMHKEAMSQVDRIFDQAKENPEFFKDETNRKALTKKFEEAFDLGWQRVEWTENYDTLRDEVNERALEVRTFKTLALIGAVFITFGIIISSVGFYLWYTRIQRFTDAKLKKQSQVEQGDIVNDEAAPHRD